MRKLLPLVACILVPSISPVFTSILFISSPVTAHAQEEAPKRRGVRVGDQGVGQYELAGFDDEGYIRWRLKGAEARPERANSTGMGENEVWLLKDISLQNYDRGALRATITSPECRYSSADHKASGNDRLTMVSKFFDAVGKVWEWNSSGDTDIIRIQQDVRVTLQPAGELKSPIHIYSNQLEARTQKGGGTEFIFSGKVRVLMEDKDRNPISMTSDSLVVRLNVGVGQISNMAATGPGQLKPKESSSGNPIDAVETITATGNVCITSQGWQMYGDSSIYAQAAKTFTTLGNTRVEYPRQRLRVEGEKIVYDIDKEKIEVDSQNTLNMGETKPVTLHLPSFVPQGDQPVDPNGIAVVTGKKLRITRLPKTNHIELEGDVHVIDSKFDLRSGYLDIETPQDNSFFASGNDKLDRVNYIIAKDNVRATYETRILRCGQAEIRPEKNLLLLTGYPVMEAPESGAKLSGHSIAMNKLTRRVEVESSPDSVADRRRVQVSLPPLKTLATQRVEKKNIPPMLDTTVTSDRLVMTEEKNDIAHFEFTGNVMLKGAGIEGSCQKMDVLADTKKAQVARPGSRQDSNASLVRTIVAVGNVRLSTEDYTAEGGRAEIFPRVALQEYSAQDDNGMDGREPQFITLSSDASTPGLRPRLTVRSAPSLDLDNKANEQKAKEPTSGMGPITIESDFQEIVSGSERSRFFMRGNVLLSGKDLKGECDTVEGIILTKQKTIRDLNAEFSLQKIIGRKNVHITADGNYARGELLEMFPLERKLYLSGDPHVRTKDGIEAMSGNRIIYDGVKKGWEIEAKPADPGEQVVKPIIRIPLQGQLPLPGLKTTTGSAN